MSKPIKHRNNWRIRCDTINGLRDDVREVIAALQQNDTETAAQTLGAIEGYLSELLSRYEAALTSAGISLPYAKR